MVNPWDKLENETVKGYAAFTAFLDLGPQRTIRAAAKIVGCGESNLKQCWVYKHNWHDRALAFDTAPRVANINARINAAESAGADSEIRHMREEVQMQLDDLHKLNCSATKKLVERMDTLQPDEIKASSMPSFMRAVAALSNAVTNERAALQGLDDILSAIDDGQD